jgi:elongation factor P
MLIKVNTDLFRILELHHLTPGNKRAHIQVRMRNIRTMSLADHKFRAEEDVERAVLDEREMQYSTTTPTTTTSWTRRATSRSRFPPRRSATRRTI